MGFLGKSKKVLCGVLVTSAFTALASVGQVNAQADSINDIGTGAEYARASIIKLASSNIISGDTQGNFHPLKAIKRSEMIKLVVSSLQLDITSLPDKQTFTDVPKSNWAFPYVEAAYKAGIVKGITTEVFGADRECTREEIASLFVRALGVKDTDLKGRQPYMYINRMTDKNTISTWAKDNVEFAMSAGLMKGMSSNTFGAKQAAQRQQVAVLTDRFVTGKADVDKLADKFKGEVDYPELYNALQAGSEKYKGNVEMDLTIGAKDSNGTILSDITMGMTGVLDSDMANRIADFDINYDVGANVLGTEISQKFRVIKLVDKIYIKYPDPADWEVMPQEEFDQIGSMFGDSSGNSTLLLNYYRYAEISKETVSDFHGQNAVKYTFNLGPDAMESMMSGVTGEQAEELEGLEPSNMEDMTGNIVVYLNDKNQVMYEKVEFAGKTWDDTLESNISVNYSLGSYYYNIGSDVEIKAPEVTP